MAVSIKGESCMQYVQLCRIQTGMVSGCSKYNIPRDPDGLHAVLNITLTLAPDGLHGLSAQSWWLR